MGYFLAWNVSALLKCRTFQKEASKANLIPALVSGPGTLAIDLFFLLGTVYINLSAVSCKLKRKNKHTQKTSAST